MNELTGIDARPVLTGAERAAIVLRELGEDVAVNVLRQMDEASIAKISSAMARLQKISPLISNEVMQTFEADMAVGSVGEEGLRYISKVLISALGAGDHGAPHAGRPAGRASGDRCRSAHTCDADGQ
jgi:flagellar motor switch protein FliG